MVFEKSLTAMVKGIRAHRGKENEYINACIQEIQKEVTSKNLATKSMAILKLAYLNMLGYDMSWATFAVVEVMSHTRFAVKRPGYLASSICFNDNTDVGLLTINLFKKDLGSKTQYESGMAISCLSSICTPEISRDIVTDLLAMLSSSRAYLRKKTVLCLYRIFLKDPPSLRTAFPKLKDRLGDEDQGVLTATVNTFLELARKNARNYLSLVPQLYHILANTSNNWLTIKLLKVFQLLCPLEPRLPSKMVEPLNNILNTTKAMSVEYEAIRCCIRVMPEGTALMSLAIEKLQIFLNSSDRNLRYLALELFKELLEQPQFKERANTPELHAKVLAAIEESDVTARKIALQLLDRIVSPASFVDTVKKLMEFSKKAGNTDEFVGTILRMGGRDRYALVEDFPWYLLVLAELARNTETAHAAEIAEQFVDISVRVAQVRPYTVALALSLLDGSLAAPELLDGDNPLGDSSHRAKEGCLDTATQVVGACAWVIGEFAVAVEQPAETTFVKAAQALLVPKHIQSLEPAIQTQCIWAATKIYLVAPAHAPGALTELHGILEAQLPVFIQSTHVDVSERATLSLHLAKSLNVAAASVTVGSELVSEALLPVHKDAQAAVPLPEGLGLDEPFFKQEEIPREVFAAVRSDTQDPYALAATYKDDLGFLAQQDKARQVTQTPKQSEQSSMFYLQARDKGADKTAEAGAEAPAGAAAAAVDPLDRMRQQLLKQAGSGQKFEVMRDDVGVPPATAGAAVAANAAVFTTAAASSGISELTRVDEKVLTDLQGRMWAACYRDEHLCVYACVRARNAKKQLLRIELRCERVSQDAGVHLAAVRLQLPEGVTAQEADQAGSLDLHAGDLTERSAKVKVNLSLAPFASPSPCTLTCELKYMISQTPASKPLELMLPATSFLSPAPVTEDAIAEYMANNADKLMKSDQVLSLASPYASEQALSTELPSIVSKCVGLCNFFGIQQSGGGAGKGHKFLLVAIPPQPPAAGTAVYSAEALPAGSLLVCRLVATPSAEKLELKMQVKAVRQDVCDGALSQLCAMFQELLEGRLK